MIKRDRLYFVSIFMIALMARAGHFVMLHNDPIADVLMLDSLAYDQTARLILEDGLPAKVYFQAPFYPYFLAFLYRISNYNPDLIRAVQMLLDTLSALLVFSITNKLFNLRSALFAGLGMAVYPVAIFQSGLILKTTLNIFFACLMLWLMFNPTPRQTWRRFGLLGLITGLAAANQGSVLLQIPIVFLWILVDSGLSNPKNWLTRAGWMSVGLVLSIGPFTVRNFIVSGRIVLLSSQGGANFYLGNSPYSDGTSKRPPRVRMTPEYEEDDFHREAERQMGRRLNPEESSRFWTQKAFQWIREHPRDALKLQARKLGLFWNKVEVPDNFDFDFYRRYSVCIRFPRYPFWIVGSLGLSGMILAVRTWKKTWLLYIWIVSYCCIWVAFHIYSRYRLPVVAFLLPFSGVFCDEYLALWKKKKFPSMMIWALIVAGFAWVQHLPLTSYSHAQPLHNLGAGLTRIGKLEEAKKAYQEALTIEPEYEPAMVNLGKIAWSTGDHQTAVSWWQKTLQAHPDSIEANSNMGVFYASTGNMMQARNHFSKAVGIQPYYFLGWLHLAQSQQAMGNFGEALEAFDMAIGLNPGDVQALYGRAICYDAIGDKPGALHAWKDYLRIAADMIEEKPFVAEAEKRMAEMEIGD